MRITTALLVLLLLLGASGAAPEEPSAQRLIGAYYYPWYYKDRWTQEPVTNTPKLGWYSSDDPDVAAQRRLRCDCSQASQADRRHWSGKGPTAADLP